MPNQKNYPEKLVSVQDVRPSRISQKDLNIIQQTNIDGSPREGNVVFGITERDVVELYVYDDLDQIVAHANIRPTDSALRLIAFAPNQPDAVGRGQDLTPDFLQLDLVAVLNRLELVPGRYSVTLNYFRDEVGKEYEYDDLGDEAENRNLVSFEGLLYRKTDVTMEEGEVVDLVEGASPIKRQRGPRLFIKDISPSRTELRLQPVEESYEIQNQLREFVDPSIPQFVAQALIDQTYGASISEVQLEAAGIETDSIAENFEIIKFQRIETNVYNAPGMDVTPDPYKTENRIKEANLEGAFYAAYDEAMVLIRDAILDVLAQHTEDVQVQEDELLSYVREGTHQALVQAVTDGAVDPRLLLLDLTNEPILPTTTEQS